MRSFSDVVSTLRRKNISQYGLLAGCCFFSVLLISAYVSIMRSPTVLTVLPEGGDSRKQVMMIFVMAIIGCAVFTTYASGLFFRHKSREVGIFLALGAQKRTLRRVLSIELLLLAGVSCISGMLLGVPLSWLIWQCFRILIVDSKEMKFVFNPQALLFALGFSIFVFLMLFIMMVRFLKRTNILEVINEARKSETIRVVPKRFGWLGIVLIVVGLLLGYQMPAVFINGLNWYPPGFLTAIFYIPAIIGLYMVLLHTVVNGWHHGKNRYKSIISTSMMRFQGRQTVRNMIVIALLVTGGFFGAFYTPLMVTSAGYTYKERTIDYLFHYRSDQNLPDELEIRNMAEEMEVNITGFSSASSAVLGIDGEEQVETIGAMGSATFEKVYRELLKGDMFVSESAYNNLTGEKVDLLSGTVASILANEGETWASSGKEVTLITNAVTGEQFPVKSAENVICNTQFLGYKVLDDADYERMTVGLTDDWREEIVAFNVENVDETYDFAKALFHEIVDRSGPEVEVFDAWDPIAKKHAEQLGEPYWVDNENLIAKGSKPISYESPDSNEFRMYWKYMPQFRVMDENEFIKTMAVFMMLFIFVSIICLAAVIVILFTRSMTIAMTNRQVYVDLGKLGSSKKYLYDTVRSQISRIFVAPIATGTSLIALFYTMILYFNDGRFSDYELSTAGDCILIVAAVSMLLYVLYRLTLSRICRSLSLSKKVG